MEEDDKIDDCLNKLSNKELLELYLLNMGSETMAQEVFEFYSCESYEILQDDLKRCGIELEE